MKNRKRGMDGAELAAWIMARLAPNGACLDWPGAEKAGYGIVRIGRRLSRAHRIVCEHAHGPAPPGKPHAIHSCDRPICCNPEHLRWGSHADNARDKMKRGRAGKPYGEAHGLAKLTASRVREIRALRAAGASSHALTRRFGVNKATILSVIHRRTWRHV